VDGLDAGRTRTVGDHVQHDGHRRRDSAGLAPAVCVLADGEPVGIQDIGATDFGVLREVHTGSWIGQRFQGRGIGTQMRAAVLHLAFEGLGAREATSAAHRDNAASNAISRKLGYVPDGMDRLVARGEAVVHDRYRLDREAWLAHRTVPVTMDGLTDACLADLGAVEAVPTVG
jgi:RimJ/RimL family protein N-acetyltransferase